MPSLEFEVSELFSAATIQLDLCCTNRENALRELVEMIPGLRRNAQAKEQLHRALMAREELCSTGLGHGIAVPHTRNTITASAGQTLVIFGRHPTGIDYGAADQMPIRLFFLLLASDIQRHLQMLSRLTRLLRCADVRTQLLAANNAHDVIAAIRSAETRHQRTGSQPLIEVNGA
jgi:mannitol/fructose-specific phosphotransferase system IIA component (Ntr-type)